MGRYEAVGKYDEGYACSGGNYIKCTVLYGRTTEMDRRYHTQADGAGISGLHYCRYRVGIVSEGT